MACFRLGSVVDNLQRAYLNQHGAQITHCIVILTRLSLPVDLVGVGVVALALAAE